MIRLSGVTDVKKILSLLIFSTWILSYALRDKTKPGRTFLIMGRIWGNLIENLMKNQKNMVIGTLV